ncbi:hypothetical protein [Microbacterium halophytorum]|uniref:hypothetical protein n=1 Tax=Microbacterium halophytorum TaxID=2067568 RepID=UPI000CFD4A7D|nr:hypothetical protein [Microbacterium halophytorum]
MLVGQAQQFAAELDLTIRSVFDCEPNIRAQHAEGASRILVSAYDPGGKESLLKMPLRAHGQIVAHWTFYAMVDASHDGHLRIDELRMSLLTAHRGLRDAPIVRLEYQRRNTRAPVAHWQFHAERGDLSYALARTSLGTKNEGAPRSLQDLHFTTGGRRFRPVLEDFLQFLIEDCGFDALPGSRNTLAAGREAARRRQARTVARDFPHEVAGELRVHGWKVEPPDGAKPPENSDVLREY